jgi:hypothetical protein
MEAGGGRSPFLLSVSPAQQRVRIASLSVLGPGPLGEPPSGGGLEGHPYRTLGWGTRFRSPSLIPGVAHRPGLPP